MISLGYHVLNESEALIYKEVEYYKAAETDSPYPQTHFPKIAGPNAVSAAWLPYLFKKGAFYVKLSWPKTERERMPQMKNTLKVTQNPDLLQNRAWRSQSHKDMMQIHSCTTVAPVENSIQSYTACGRGNCAASGQWAKLGESITQQHIRVDCTPID